MMDSGQNKQYTTFPNFLSLIIVKNLMRFYGLGLYSKGNTFSWKIIIGKVWGYIMNFATMSYGGAEGF